jgi:hypothetical protein
VASTAPMSALSRSTLFRYLDERVFTYNMRDLTDLGHFTTVLGMVSDRRLTYAGLAGYV